jgi:AcrR family transcriptional regulator
MGHKYSREEILDGALRTALTDGLSQLTFGRLARRLDVSDRVIVYYFPSKTELIVSVLTLVADQLQAVLAVAFTHPAAGHIELARSAWPVLATDDADPIFGLYFEAIGQATAGIEPFAGLAGQLLEGWICWLSEFFRGTQPRRRAEAEATLALLDGLLLLRQLAGGPAANRAAAALGLR